MYRTISVMTKKTTVLIIALLVLAAFGTGYFIHKTSGTVPASDQRSQTTTPRQESTGTTVDLSGQQLTAIPESVLSRTDITSLNLSNNQLTTLPAGIEKLTNLEVLNIENNRLESLPAEIGLLKKLRVADFSNNRLTSLPAELGNLTGLQSLNLNGYKSSPNDIDQLRAKLPNTEIKS